MKLSSSLVFEKYATDDTLHFLSKDWQILLEFCRKCDFSTLSKTTTGLFVKLGTCLCKLSHPIKT